MNKRPKLTGAQWRKRAAAAGLRDPRWSTVGRMTDDEFSRFLDEWLAQQPVDEAGLAEENRVVAVASANWHLRAYRIDRNPDHIFNAVQEYLRLKVPLPPVMLRNLERALDERHKKPTGNPRTNTLRDVYVIAAVARRYRGEIPERVDGEMLAALARRHGVTIAVVKNVISRVRKLISANLRYQRPPAFR